MKYLLYILGALVSLGFISCDKFLEDQPKGTLIPKKTIDYERILNGEFQSKTVADNLIYAGDDLTQQFTLNDKNVQRKLYFWEESLDEDISASPAIWGYYYSAIYSNNIIIKEVLTSEEGSEAYKRSVWSEAMVNRADLYFQLMTCYSPVFNKATVKTDFGIPLVTSIDILDRVPPRASVEASMDTIIANIKAAIPYLPKKNINKIRVTKYGAYALLSRIYLSMYEYDKALEYADLALGADHAILNYNDYSANWKLPEVTESPEHLWVRYCDFTGRGNAGKLSADVLKYFDPSDRRYTLFVYKDDDKDLAHNTSKFTNVGISFGEVYLTKAECMARTGDVEGAMKVLNEFRVNRVEASSYEELIANDAEEAIDLILADRRRELVLRPIRLMDIRRLRKDGRMKDIQRLDLNGNVIATLPVSSPKYVLQIPVRVITFNPDMPKNKRN